VNPGRFNPPDYEDKAIELVLEQAELFAASEEPQQ